ncbi:MAG: peptidylprolyl isomerase [Candidatus Paceibacterota bacterium]
MAVKSSEQQISRAILKTTSGNIEIQFFSDKAPATVANFVKLTQSGFYDGVKFHRVIKDFMIQSGDPLSKGDNTALYGRGGPGYTFPDEINDQKIVRGVIAMANAGPNTNGSQFFIVTAAATPWLDGKHTVFGKVVSGMDVVDKINNVITGESDIPKTPIVINSIELK